MLALLSVALFNTAGSFWTYTDDQGEELARQQRVLTMPSTALVEWPEEADASDHAPCEWYNGTYVHEPSLCSHFAMQRLRSDTVQRATHRALKCAAAWGTDCVLSVEIGFGVPTAFVYDEQVGLRAIVAPRPLPLVDGEGHATGGKGEGTPDGAASSESVSVRVEDPGEQDAPWVLSATRRLRVEFVAPPSRQLQTETLEGAAAYCVQALRHAISRRCWDALD